MFWSWIPVLCNLAAMKTLAPQWLTLYAIGIVRTLSTCNHSQSDVTQENSGCAEGKTFCARCGEGLILRWVLLRCSGCEGIRPSRYFLRRIVPQSPCCRQCGAAQVRYQYLEDPPYFQLRHALLLIQEEAEYLESLANERPSGSAGRWFGWTHAWLNPETSKYRPFALLPRVREA